MYRSFVSIMVLTIVIVLSSCDAFISGMAIGAAMEEQKWLEQKFIQSKIITDAGVLTPIKSIALLDIPSPHHYLPYYLEVEPTVAGKDTKKYEDFNFSVIFQQYLKEHLEAEGYRVISLSVSRENPYKLLDDYSHLNAPDVDAFLDLAPVEVGFTTSPWTWAGPFTSEVGPHLSVVVRLISADSKKILYAESVQYGYDKNPFLDGAMIEPPPDDNFKDTDVLKAQNEKAIEQLAHGIDAVSRAIAERLSR